MGQYADAVGWDLDFRQLETGSLEAKVKAIAVNYGMILNVDFNRSFHQVGSSPDGQLTFGIPNAGVGNFEWCSAHARGGSLLNFNLDGGFEGISPRGFNGHTFTFNLDALQTFADNLGLDEDLETLVKRQSYWRSAATISLSRQLCKLSRQLESPGNQALHENADLLNEELATVVLDSLIPDSTCFYKVIAGNRHGAVKKSLEILDDCDNLPITVRQLCALVESSQSTLKRGFIEEFGIPPKVYIRNRCLSAARDELAMSPPGTLVTDVANLWGFWHMGQFAADYRMMFGELPSITLKRSR